MIITTAIYIDHYNIAVIFIGTDNPAPLRINIIARYTIAKKEHNTTHIKSKEISVTASEISDYDSHKDNYCHIYSTSSM